ncbi:MAG: Arginine--tRNA ligase [Patescibacteria group bacterium]|nr:Arginine--tRNA ligase [Patescibacteria group bacterium]
MAFGKQEIIGVINEALHELGVSEVSFSVEQPQELTHGDYATNVALIAGKRLNISPKECAEKIVSVLKKGEAIKDVHIAGPGFINFFLNDDIVQDINKQKIEKLETKYTGKNILVEHSSPNLFKPFHIGHLMNNIVGEFVSRAVEVGGGDVKEISFPSDVSLGIAKAAYIIFEDKKQGFDFDSEPLNKQIIYFGDVYKKGVAYFDEHPDEIQKAKDIAHIIFDETSKSEEYRVYDTIKEKNIDYFINILNSLGSNIHPVSGIIFESQAGNRGRKIIEENTGEGKVFQKGEGGAIIYTPDETRKDINTTVFVNSDGYPTYEGKDLGLIDIKFTKFNPDISFFITDAEQAHHFKIVLDAASKLSGKWPEWVEKSKHIPHGRMLFKGQKMSSRLGGVPLAFDVIDLVTEEAESLAGEKIIDLPEKDKADLWKEIALSALRIAVLRSKPGLNINFDPESSLSFEGDSGPYLLYTHARCASLLEKGKGDPEFGSYGVTPLERGMVHAEEMFVKAIEDLAPQQLVTYLFSIAQLFNSWYAQEQIITDDKEKTAHNLAVVARVKNILERGLYILGIEAPNKM